MRRLCDICKNRIFRAAVIALLSVMAAVSVYQGVRNALVYSQDFQWDAAKALSQRIDPYDVSLGTAKADTPELSAFYDYFVSIDAPQKMEANQFPSLLMLLLPYTFLPQDLARSAWLFTNLLCTAGIILLLKKTFLRDTDRFVFAVLILLMLSGTPYRNQLGVGQHTLFSLFFFLLAVWLFEKSRGSIPSILCLAISYFKYTLTAVLAVYLIYRRKWRELIASILIHVVLTEVSALWLHEGFLDMLVKPLKVSSALISEGGLDFGTLFGGSPLAFLPAFAVMAGLVVLAFKVSPGNDRLLMAVLLLWSLIILYHRTYDFFPLIMVAGAFTGGEWGKCLRDKEREILICLFAILLLSVFFILRLFHEALWIRIVTGVMYYGYTIWMSTWLIRTTYKEPEENGNGK